MAAKQTLSRVSIVILTVLLWAGAVCAEPRLVALDGEVTIGHGDPVRWRSASAGDLLAPGDQLRTGSSAHAEVDLGSATVRLYENSLLRLPGGRDEAQNPHSVRLEEGRSLFDVVKRKLGLPNFEVETPQVVVSVKGTRFEVALGSDLAEVSVFHGVVGLREPRANELVETLVREGFAARGGVGQPFELEVSMDSDPWDRWRDAAPAQLERQSRLPDRETMRAQVAEVARRAARKSSDAQVINHAARRNPRVAKRVAKLAKENRRSKLDAGTLREAARGAAFEDRVADQAMPPAAPDPGAMTADPDPEDLMEDMGITEDPDTSVPPDPDGSCTTDCGDPDPDPMGQVEILQELMAMGFGMNEIQFAIETAINDLGANEIHELYLNGGDYQTLLFDYFTTQENLADEVAQLLIDLLEAYAGSL